MKVVCTHSEGLNPPSLTIGKMYDVIKEVSVPFSPKRYDDPCGNFYLITCDDNQRRHIRVDRFRQLTQSEKREIKLIEIGI